MRVYVLGAAIGLGLVAGLVSCDNARKEREILRAALQESQAYAEKLARQLRECETTLDAGRR